MYSGCTLMYISCLKESRLLMLPLLINGGTTMYAEKIFLGLGFDMEETEVGVNFSRGDVEIYFDIANAQIKIIENSNGEEHTYGLSGEDDYTRHIILPSVITEEVAEAILAVAIDIRKQYNDDDWNLQVDIEEA